MKKRSVMNDKGFSLVEMIVAVLIMAIIGGLAVVAFGSIFKLEPDAAARKVSDSLKQARVNALGLSNKTDTATKTTDVCAKLFTEDSRLHVDVNTCYFKNESGVSKRSYETIFEQEIGSDSLQIELYKKDGNKIATVGSDVAYIYFKKETGGVESVEVSGTKYTDVCKIRVVNSSATSNYSDLILVNLTGRCYTDDVEVS